MWQPLSGPLALGYIRAQGLDLQRVRERIEQRNRLEAMALRLRLQADESPAAPPRPAATFAPAPPPDILTPPVALAVGTARRGREDP